MILEKTDRRSSRGLLLKEIRNNNFDDLSDYYYYNEFYIDRVEDDYSEDSYP